MTYRWLFLLLLIGAASAPGRAQQRSAESPAAPPQPPLLSTIPSPGAERPEPSQMSGFPLQVGDLAPGTVAIRVVRQGFGNNVVNHPVELQVTEGNRRTLQSTTDPAGRAVFTGLQIGETVVARTSVDGELLQSSIFQLPSQGGVRVALVAGIGASSGIPAAPAAPAPAADDRAQSWTVPAIFAVLGLGVWALGVRAYLHAKRRAPVRGTDARDALFDTLMGIEDDFEAGRLGREPYEQLRGRLIEQLVDIDLARLTRSA